MQARYQSPEVGRFVGQDPAFLAVGDTKKLKDTTKIDIDKYLADSQGFNSYSYARNNPLRLIDENGEWYVEVGFTASIGPYTGGFGVRTDSAGIVAFYTAGAGLGLMAEGGIEFNSGDIDIAKPEFTVSREGAFAAGPAVRATYEGQFAPENSLSIGSDGKMSYGVGIGIGARINQTYTQSVPILRFSEPQSGCIGCSYKKDHSMSGAYNTSYVSRILHGSTAVAGSSGKALTDNQKAQIQSSLKRTHNSK